VDEIAVNGVDRRGAGALVVVVDILGHDGHLPVRPPPSRKGAVRGVGLRGAHLGMEGPREAVEDGRIPPKGVEIEDVDVPFVGIDAAGRTEVGNARNGRHARPRQGHDPFRRAYPRRQLFERRFHAVSNTRSSPEGQCGSTFRRFRTACSAGRQQKKAPAAAGAFHVLPRCG